VPAGRVCRSRCRQGVELGWKRIRGCRSYGRANRVAAARSGCAASPSHFPSPDARASLHAACGPGARPEWTVAARAVSASTARTQPAACPRAHDRTRASPSPPRYSCGAGPWPYPVAPAARVRAQARPGCRARACAARVAWGGASRACRPPRPRSSTASTRSRRIGVAAVPRPQMRSSRRRPRRAAAARAAARAWSAARACGAAAARGASACVAGWRRTRRSAGEQRAPACGDTTGRCE
jgi:hypothetical protein